MFEYHGWVTVRDCSGAVEAATDLSRATHDEVVDLIGALDGAFQVADLRVANGSCHVWLAGLRNHRQDNVLDVFRQIAALAPRSYGVLHVTDAEADDDRWFRWVMSGGTVISHVDDSLTSYVFDGQLRGE